MKKPAGVIILYSLIGSVIFIVLASINQKASNGSLALSMMIIPSLIGVFAGFLLGYYRKKWMDQSRELERATTELENQLASVEGQKKHTENLERLLTNIPLPVYLKDKNHQYVLANKHYEELAGVPWSEFQGKSDYDIFPEPIADLFREQDIGVLKDGVPKTFEETVPLNKGIITFETSKFPVSDGEEKIYALGGVCKEITQLKEAEDRLKSEEQRLEMVLRHLEAGVITSDSLGKITMFNRKATQLTGYDSASAIGQNLTDIYQAQDARTGAAVQLNPGDSYSTSGQTQEQEIILISEEGEATELSQKTAQLLDGFGQHAGLLIILQLAEDSEQISSMVKKQSLTTASTNHNQEGYPNGLILVMDDDSLVRKTTKLMLARGGFDTILAKDGEEAVLLYGKHMKSDEPIDAIIMDLTVPGGMGGVEATEKIMALDPEAKIMVASGYSTDPILANYLAYGFLARVEKPFDLNELLRTIRYITED